MEYILDLCELIADMNVGCLKLLPFLVVLVYLSLAPLHHSVQIEDALLERGQSLVLQLLRLNQIVFVSLVLIDVAFQFFLFKLSLSSMLYNYDVFILHYFGLVKLILSAARYQVLGLFKFSIECFPLLGRCFKLNKIIDSGRITSCLSLLIFSLLSCSLACMFC